MKSMHRLLQRQLKRHYGGKPVPSEWENLIQAVNQAYFDFDTDRGMLERSLELSSQELLQANSELIALIQAFPDIFLRLSSQGEILTYKRIECGDRHPWSENLVGADFCDVVGERYAAKFKEALRHVRELNAITNLEFVLTSKGIPYHYESRLVPMENHQIFVIIRDITERKQAEEQLIYFSMFDPLTNLYNRAFFEREMQRLENACCNPLGFIICDVDNLKMINDNYGHNSGDLLLMEVANVLHKSLRKQDIVARIGGDEFAIIMPNSDSAAVESTCLRIREAIARYNDAAPRLPISLSMGYSIRKLAQETMDDIFKQADDNMYKEKYIHHKRLTGDLIRSVSESLINNRFVVQGTTEYSEMHGTNAVISFGRPGSSWENLNIVMKLNKENNDGNIFLPGLPGDKNIEEYRDYLKALLIMLGLVLDSLPDET